MKQILFVMVCGFIMMKAGAQHQLVKLWETDSLLKVPESVLYDEKNQVLYVSNIDGKDPWGKDGKGSIGKVSLDGKIIAAEWVTGLHAPKGMGLYNGRLYVADLSEIAVIDVTKGAIEKRIPVDEAVSLNDISIDKAGTLYVSDSRSRKVFGIPVNAQNEYWIALDSSQLKGPNGVLVYNDALYVLDAGIMYHFKHSKKEKSFIKITEGMEGGTDGIENVTGNEFLVSTWSGVVYYVYADGTKQVLMDGREQKINSADIGYDAKRRIVYVPTFWKNTLAAYELK
jgi:sugar lactone lactonase YvrE